MANTESAEKTVSARSVENYYKDSAGKLHSRPIKDLVGIVKKFKDTGETLEVGLADFPEHIQLALMAFGAHQAMQNAYGGSKDSAEKIELASARLETLTGGDWQSGTQSGPGTSLLLQACIRGYTKKNGHEPDEAWIDERRELLKDEDVAKDYQKRPAIKAHLEAIKAERQAARAAKALEAAGQDDDEFE